MNQFKYALACILLLLFQVHFAGAQSVGVKSDRNQILIGERLQYDLMINVPAPGYRINLNLPDSVPHFEVIENSNFDTVSNNAGVFLIHKKIVFTSFDSGGWYIPSFEVFVDRDNSSRKFNTDSIFVDVTYSPSDSTNALRDIKPVMEVTVTDYFWIYVGAVALGVIMLLYLLYRYLKNRKKKPAPIFHSDLTPYNEAIKAIDALKKYDLKKPADLKTYHSSLGEIFKRYYSRKYGMNLLNNTTGARFSHPFTKLFEEERELTLMLLIDTSTSNLFGTIGKRKKELITEIAAVLAFSAVSNNDKVGVIFFSNKVEKYIPPKKGRPHALFIVRELLSIEPKTRGTNLDAAIKYFNNTTRQKSISFLLSDFLDTGYENDLKVIGKKHDVIGIKVYDKMDMQLPDAGLLQLQDAETGKVKLVDSSNPQVRYNYQQHFFQQTDICTKYFRKAGADLLHVRTDEDYVKVLQKFFLKRK